MFSEDAGDLGVIHPERFILCLGKIPVRWSRFDQHGVFGPESLIEHQHTDVHQQSSKKAFLALSLLGNGSNRSRGGGGVDTSLPIIDVLESTLAFVF